MTHFASLFFMLIFLVSCKETEEARIVRLVKEWDGKEIVYPSKAIFTVLGSDTVKFAGRHENSVVVYVDSTGCMSCKLQLPEWRKLITEFDSLSHRKVPFLFYFHSKEKSSLLKLLKRVHFNYPVCIDENDSLNKLNHFPNDMMFQTFLLDKENKVVAMGNPIHNKKVKDLYLSIILGKKNLVDKVIPQTTVSIFENEIDMGRFNYLDEQQASFLLQNSGSDLLVINDAITSCGCTTVVYNKVPVKPGESVELKVTYKADHPEHFNKTITVYCNTASSPIKLEIKGNAE